MGRKDQYLIISVTLFIIYALLISGCVEVTPPSGTQNASAYGSTGTGGNLTAGHDRVTAGPTTGSNQANESTNGPEGKVPPPPDAVVVQVTPRSLEGLPTSQVTQSYSAKINTAAITPGEEFVTIYAMNHSFANDAIAYAYVLENPPLYVDLLFSPKMGEDIIAHEDRLGDKGGTGTDKEKTAWITEKVTRPLKDAWFEIRVYNQKDGSEVLREGYGKTYSQSNKTFALRAPGSYQFDMVGNLMNATVKLKVPRSLADISMYQNVSDMVNTQKENEGKISGVFLVASDLPAGWAAIGDITRTTTNYQSLFQKDYITLKQKITRYDSTEIALAELEKLKSSEGSGSSPTLVGQSGFQVDSTSKSHIAFVQGLYLVELSSFSVPDHVSLTDLQGYGKIIVTKINSGQ